MSRFASFRLALWNPQTRKCLGRTGDSWLKLIGFYIALYSCLAAIWSLYFAIFRLTISDKYPKWQLEESLIGTNPGLGLRPQSPRERVESALISFRAGPGGDYKHWVDDLAAFLGEYDHSKQQQEREKATVDTQDGAQHNGGASNETILEDCSMVGKNSSSSPNGRSQAICPFDSSSIGPACTQAQNFSFALGQPCLLLKLNRIYGWLPEPYQERPAEWPQEAEFAPGNIHITCEGQHDADKEHLGKLEYFPQGGIETKYYPFLNQPGYQSPYVMVHFKEPKLNTLIYVECKAWAKNIAHDRYNRKGMTTFELFIEKADTPTEAGSA